MSYEKFPKGGVKVIYDIIIPKDFYTCFELILDHVLKLKFDGLNIKMR